MLPPGVLRRLRVFGRDRLTGHLTLHFHQGALTRYEYTVSQRPDEGGGDADAGCKEDHSPARAAGSPPPDPAR